MQAKDVNEKEILPWQGLTLACVRILQLYCRVFEQDFHYYIRIKEYVKLLLVSVWIYSYIYKNLNRKVNSYIVVILVVFIKILYMVAFPYHLISCFVYIVCLHEVAFQGMCYHDNLSFAFSIILF